MNKKSSSVFFTDKETLNEFSLANQFADHLEFDLVKDKVTVTMHDVYFALSLSIRDRLIRRWLRTQHEYKENDVKRVYYLSMEYMMGRLLGNALINMDYYETCYSILKEEGKYLEDIREYENDMGLGNGGLGRLASCYLDSMATLELPAFGYGIRYEYGIFEQNIENGWQVELPDNWLSYGCPWEIMRRGLNFKVKFGGKVNLVHSAKGKIIFDWVDTEDVFAVGYDVPIPGYRTNTVNNLRLWHAKATNEFNFKDFNAGNYLAAVEEKYLTETISKVLYPNDTFAKGKFLRIKQQYFFVSATLQDIIRKYKINHSTYDKFAEKTAIQLNDTHPVMAIPELMRILLDEENLNWDYAWEIVQKVFAYTNHTVVPEALEEWSVSIFEQLLPRHLQIIYEINQRFLDSIRENYQFDDSVISQLSIVREGADKKIRMANLAIIACHSVNGVAELHTKIIRENIFPEFNTIFPKKFKNITNGITPRRWLKSANPILSRIITSKIGDAWIKDLSQLTKLEKFVDDENFLETWQDVKLENKRVLAELIEKENNIKINVESIFDVQVKRFHEYKRQLLNLIHVITLYNRLKDNPELEIVPRTVIFAGKAAPAYYMAKLVIKLINAVADVINDDKTIKDKLKVVFMKNYSVTLAERIIPAADLSEQISTAGFEASGTGNMKFALNGALTIGTMDGANVEMREEIGDDNIFIFGLRANEVANLKQSGYNPREYLEKIPELKRVLSMIAKDHFNKFELGIFQPIIDGLLNVDYYCLFADYESYIQTQEKVSELFKNKNEWAKKSILNVARMGKFSSDRSIKEYAENIWGVTPIKIDAD